MARRRSNLVAASPLLRRTDLLDRSSTTARHGVPQTLDYLIRDVERQHGRVRIGAAGCYLRCADSALTEEVVRTRTLSRLQLRQVATSPGSWRTPTGDEHRRIDT
ncbi:MAG: helicase-associated domain-containing protein [Mycobacteriales bacterium]